MPSEPFPEGREENCSGGGGHGSPFSPNPPPPSLAAVTGGGVQGRGARPGVPGGGGGVNPTSMAQNDTHVALIILTTQMWGGKLLVENFFGPKFVFLRLRRQHPFFDKTKGPTRNPISPTPPPPSFGGRPCPPPPPPPQSNFQVAKPRTLDWQKAGTQMPFFFLPVILLSHRTLFHNPPPPFRRAQPPPPPPPPPPVNEFSPAVPLRAVKLVVHPNGGRRGWGRLLFGYKCH